MKHRKNLFFIFSLIVCMLASFALQAQDVTDDQVLEEMTSFLHHLNGDEGSNANINNQLKFLEKIKPIWKNPDFQKLRKTPIRNILENSNNEQDNPYHIAALAFHDEEIVMNGLTLIHDEKEIFEKILEFRDQLRGKRGYSLLSKTSLEGIPFPNSLKFLNKAEIDVLSFQPNSNIKFRISRIGLNEKNPNGLIEFTVAYPDRTIMSPEAAPTMKDLARGKIIDLVECFVGSGFYVFSTVDGAVIARQIKIDPNNLSEFSGVDPYYYLLKPPDGSTINSLSLVPYPLDDEHDYHNGYLIAGASQNGMIYLWHMYKGDDDNLIHFDALPSIDVNIPNQKNLLVDKIALSSLGYLIVNTIEESWVTGGRGQLKLGNSHICHFYKWDPRKKIFIPLNFILNLPSRVSNIFMSPSNRHLILIFSDGDGKISCVDLENLNQEKVLIPSPLHGKTVAVAFKPSDPNTMLPHAIVSYSGLIRVRRGDSFDSTQNPKLSHDLVITDLMNWDGRHNPVIDIAFYTDDILISLSRNGDLHFWKLGVIDPDLSLIRLIDPDKVNPNGTSQTEGEEK